MEEQSDSSDKEEEHQITQRSEDSFNVNLERQTGTKEQNITSEQHSSPAISSKHIRHKRKQQIDDIYSKKQKQELHDNTSHEQISKNIKGEPSVSRLEAPSTIERDQDEPLDLSSPSKTVPKIIDDKDCATESSSFIAADVAAAGPSHFICDVCNRSFDVEDQLVRHYVSHGGDKPFSCDICNQRFTRRPNIKRHMMAKHSKELKYKCDQCGRAFPVKDYLVSHYRIHTGEKPFMCEKCGRCFSHSFNLSRHRRNCE